MEPTPSSLLPSLTDNPAAAPTPLAGKHILYAITKSNSGGAQTYVRMLAAGARVAGARVSVMAGSATGAGGSSGRLFDDLREEGIRTIALSEICRDLRSIRGEWRAYKELLSVIRQEQPDVLHLNSSKMGLLGGVAGRVAGVPRIIFTAHGWPHKEQRPLLWKLLAWVGSWLTIICAHKTVTVSETDLRNSPTLLFRDKLALVHNGISDFPHLSKKEARSALAEYAPELAEYPTWLLMNAELHHNKGVGTAVRALAELAPQHPDLALVVCGDGQERKHLTELAQERGISSQVFLLGFVPDARRYLAAADIYLMPSRKEGLPLALLEAGLASLPVIASKIGGIPEVLTDRESGLFMPRGNTHILAKAISYLLDHPDEASRFGATLRTKVLADFSANAMISQTFKLYSIKG